MRGVLPLRYLFFMCQHALPRAHAPRVKGVGPWLALANPGSPVTWQWSKNGATLRPQE